MSEPRSKSQILLDYINQQDKTVLQVTDQDMAKIFSEKPNYYAFQRLRYTIPFLTQNIVYERKDGFSQLDQKQHFVYRKLTDEEANNYQLSSINFRHLNNEMIDDIIARLNLPDASNQDLLRILRIVDIILERNQDDNWCTLSSTMFVNLLLSSISSVKMFIDLLIKAKILYRIKHKPSHGKEHFIYKLTLTDIERQEVEKQIKNGIDTDNLIIVSINTWQTRSNADAIKKSNKNLSVQNKTIDFTNTSAIINNEPGKTKGFNELLKAIQSSYAELQNKIDTMEQENQKSFKAFEAMNADYNEKSHTLDELKAANSALTESQKKHRESIPRLLDAMTAKVLDLVMDYSRKPVSDNSTNAFKSDIMAIVIDTQTSIKHILAK